MKDGKNKYIPDIDFKKEKSEKYEEYKQLFINRKNRETKIEATRYLKNEKKELKREVDDALSWVISLRDSFIARNFSSFTYASIKEDVNDILVKKVNEKTIFHHRVVYEELVSKISELVDSVDDNPRFTIRESLKAIIESHYEYCLRSITVLALSELIYEVENDQIADDDYISSKSKIDELIDIFIWQKFEPKSHNREIIADYLKLWERNQGISYPRKTTIDSLKETHPEIQNIYNKSSGGVISNWEEKWEKFRDSRTKK